MTEINQLSNDNNLNYNLDSFGLITLDKLIKWTKFVGIINIITGALYCLSILFFSIPTFIIGVITIVMGTKLTNAANHLRFAIQNKDDVSFTNAMDHFRSYFLINGILLIITIAFIALFLIFISFFFGSIMEMINDTGFDYTVHSIIARI